MYKYLHTQKKWLLVKRGQKNILSRPDQTFVSDCMWLMEGMVLAMNQGNPNTEEITTIMASTSRSRW